LLTLRGLVCSGGAPVPVLLLGGTVGRPAGIALAGLHSALALCVLPGRLPGHRILVSALLGALVPHALVGRLIPALSVGALLAALALHAALRSAAGALLGLLCVSDAARRKERKHGEAGQQHLLSIPHQALSFPVGCLRMHPR
jgi:hypothetical protein